LAVLKERKAIYWMKLSGAKVIYRRWQMSKWARSIGEEFWHRKSRFYKMNLSQCHFVHNKFQAAALRLEPALRVERPVFISLTHGTGTGCDQQGVYVMREYRLSTVVTDMIIRWQK
jgi:hypothetical protein